MMFHLLSLLILSLCTSSYHFTSATILYDDGQVHTTTTNVNESILLRTSSTLILPSGDCTIRSPSGYSAIQLQMSSTLNATGGDIMGGDASSDHPIPGAGVIVGSASTAIFYEGVTVRGGNNGATDTSGNLIYDEYYNFDYQNRGGDALVSQYFGSNITIHGGKFIGGSGSKMDGYSLHCHGEAQINVHGGSFYGSWKVNDRGSIVVTGCVNRIGSRLVGRLQSGQTLDVQLVEENGGKVVIENREKCNTYKKRDTISSASHTGTKKMTRRICLLFGIIICYLRF